MLLSKLSDFASANLVRCTDFDVDTLSVSNTKNATYLQSDKKSL